MMLLEGGFAVTELLHGWPVIALVFVTPVIAIVVDDWKATCVAWLLQAIAVMSLLAETLPTSWAFLHLLIASLVAVMWLLSLFAVERRSDQSLTQFKQTTRRFTLRNQGRMSSVLRLPKPNSQALLSTVAPFRVLAVILVAILFQNYVGQVHLPNLEGTQAIAALWLIVQGLLAVALTEEPLKGGVGLLTALAGFTLAYVAQEPAARTLLLLNALELLIGLAVAYLILVRAWPAKSVWTGSREDLQL